MKFKEFFYLLAKEVERYRIKNRSMHRPPALSGAVERRKYMYHAKIFMITMGQKVFDKANKQEESLE